MLVSNKLNSFKDPNAVRLLKQFFLYRRGIVAYTTMLNRKVKLINPNLKTVRDDDKNEKQIKKSVVINEASSVNKTTFHI